MRCLKPNAIRNWGPPFYDPCSLKAISRLFPIIAGLALSHTAMIVAGFSGLKDGFEVLRGGLGTSLQPCPCLPPWSMALQKRTGLFRKKAVDAAFFVSIIVRGGSIIAFRPITAEVLRHPAINRPFGRSL